MFISAAAVRELKALRQKRSHASDDPDRTIVGDSRLFVQRTASGYLCAGLGKSSELLRFAFEDRCAPDPMFDECRRIAKSLDAGTIRTDQVLGLDLPGDEADDPHLQRVRIAAALLKFSPDQPRDALGRWIAERIAAAAAVVSEIVIPPAVAVGTAVAAAAAVLLYPAGKSKFQEGTIEGRPDITYRYDEHILTLTQSDGNGNQRVLYHGRPDQDGYYRDDQGHIVGVDDGDTFAFDATLLPAAPATTEATAPVGAPALEPGEADASPESSAVANDDKPRLCPDPGPDRPSGMKEPAVKYQQQITGLPEGLAVSLPTAAADKDGSKVVIFDGCRESDGTMLEAKGPGYEVRMPKAANWDAWYRGVEKMEEQMKRQAAAAAQAGRKVEWHFAEAAPADYFRAYAISEGLDNVTVIHTPANQ
jgi:hypothetical protein